MKNMITVYVSYVLYVSPVCCGNNGYTKSSYASNDCTGTPTDETLPSTCTNIGNGQFAQGTACGTSGVEWSTDNMFVQTYYDGSQTCSSNIAHVIGSKVNYCFNEDSVDSSQIKDYTYKYWSGSPSFTVAIPKTCTLDGTDDNDDFDGGFYVSFVSHGAAMSNIALNFTVLISTMMVTVLALFKN